MSNSDYPGVIVYNNNGEIIEIKQYEWKQYRMYDEDNDSSFRNNLKIKFSQPQILEHNKKSLISLTISGESNGIYLLSEEYVFYEEDIYALLKKIKTCEMNDDDDDRQDWGYIITYDKKVIFIHGYYNIFIEKCERSFPYEIFYRYFNHEMLLAYDTYITVKRHNRRKSL